MIYDSSHDFTWNTFLVFFPLLFLFSYVIHDTVWCVSHVYRLCTPLSCFIIWVTDDNAHWPSRSSSTVSTLLYPFLTDWYMVHDDGDDDDDHTSCHILLSIMMNNKINRQLILSLLLLFWWWHDRNGKSNCSGVSSITSGNSVSCNNHSITTPATNTTASSNSCNNDNPFEEDHEDWDDYGPSDALIDNGEPGVPVRALYDYEGAESDELSFKQGMYPSNIHVLLSLWRSLS